MSNADSEKSREVDTIFDNSSDRNDGVKIKDTHHMGREQVSIELMKKPIYSLKDYTNQSGQTFIFCLHFSNASD